MGIELTYQLSLPLAPKIDADMLWDLTLVFAVLGFVYLVFVFIFRNRIANKNKEVRARKKELGPMISNFLFYEDDVSLQEKYNYVQLKLEIRELLKSDFNRKVLVEILLDLQRDIAGDARNRLFELYKDLGLHQDAFEKLKSKRWEVISKGILELTHLQVEESYSFIKKFINHKRGVIRKQAQIATVSLKHEGIVYFLDTCKYRISEWQQLKLLDVLRNLEDFQPPRFKAWLTAKNKDVVLFSLRLIKYYKQNDANNALIELVKHKNDQVKIEAVNCIKDFVVFDALETLKAIFWQCSVSVKLVILDAISALGKEEDIPFLSQVQKKESNFIVKNKAVSAINTISPGTVMPTHGLETVQEYEEEHEDVIAEELQLKEDIGPVNEHEGEPELAQNAFEETEVPEEEISNSSFVNKEFNEDLQLQLEESGYEDFEEIQLNWKLSSQEEEEFKAELDATTSDLKIKSEEEELQLTPDINDIKINDLEEISMGANEENIEELTPISAASGPNSEEAYWELVLDPEKEDEIVFDLCLMEELEDILVQAIRPEESYAPHEILPLDFLPIVAGEPKQPQPDTSLNEDLFNIEVEPEEVHQDAKFADELDRILHKIRTSSEEDEEEIRLDFIPFVVETEEVVVPKPEDRPVEANLQDLEVDYEAVEVGNDLLDVAKEIDASTAVSLETQKDHLKDAESLEQESINEREDKEKALDETLETFQNEPFFDLIEALDDRVSIFNELFRTCDAESKLILMDEILAVGDERDLRFLDTLINDEDQRVRKKAKKIGEALKQYLDAQAADIPVGPLEDASNKEGQDKLTDEHQEMEVEYGELLPLEFCFLQQNNNRGQQQGLFEIDFELDEAFALANNTSTKVGEDNMSFADSQSNILEDILSIPTKLIQKFNG